MNDSQNEPVKIISFKDVDQNISNNLKKITPENKRSWMNRTFSSMKPGALRGNIFLLLITTTGCAFFYIPYYGKKTGLFLLTVMLFIAGALSFFSSNLLYYGFKATKAKTYDECMTKTIGPIWGFLSNILVFAHCWGAMVSSWIFSYSFLLSILEETYGVFSNSQNEWFTYSFFGLSMLIIFFSTIFGNLDKLKFVAGWGILIIIYIIIVFFIKMPKYFQYYNQQDQFRVENAQWNIFMFKSWGMCQYIFLNQYTIIPICNNIHKVTSKRLKKVVSRTTILLCFLYITILFIGYFSQPSANLTDSLSELFILRPAIPGTNDIAVMIGKICFIFSLMVAVMIKTQFFLMYFWQIFNNISKIFSMYRSKRKASSGSGMNTKTIEEIESTMTERLMRDSECNIKKESSNLKEKKDEDPIPNQTSNLQVPNELEEAKSPQAVASRKKRIFLHIKNFFVLFLVMLLTIVLRNSLSTVLSVLGSFVGIFELTIFPFCMILIINRRIQILSNFKVILIYFIMVFFTLFGLISFVITFFVKDHVH